MTSHPLAYELNFDGLVGPTHNYAGLAFGNVASEKNKLAVSHPRQAALEGLAKIKLLAELGVPQGILPPHERPSIGTLRQMGFTGTDAQVLARAHKESPQSLAICSSASAMWAANAATLSPSADTADGRVHFTAANLANNLHRAIEAPTTAALLRAIFPDPVHFAHHSPLPSGTSLNDEGAANHTRLARYDGGPGIELFTYGRSAGDHAAKLPRRFPARQMLEASQAIARLHQLDPERTLFVRQNPDAIDGGVFHNDVIAVGNLNVLFCHALAWVNQAAVIEEIKLRFTRTCGADLIVIEVESEQVSIADAVETYLFNSQLVSGHDGSMTLICPSECRERPSTRRYLEILTQSTDHPIRHVHFVDVRQSMQNGGGPACLRLRIALTQEELRHVLPGMLWTHSMHDQLVSWVCRRYRQDLTPEDLADPSLLQESRDALAELSAMLGLGAIYPFQNR